MGCYGNTFNETPNLDQLAADGMRFTQAYAAAPVCSPYRASLMTGQYPVRTGITDYLRPNDAKHLATDYVTLPKMLKSAGYVTGLVGKWHLTGYANHGAQEIGPGEHGFAEVLVSENRDIGAGSYFFPYQFNREIRPRLRSPEYLVDRCNLEAVEFIERHQEKPFFLYLSHYAVHTRLNGKPELVAKYEAKPDAGKGALAPRNNPHLAAQLESIDQGVGMIRDKLRKLDLAQDTIIVFTGDNGGEDRVTVNGSLAWRQIDSLRRRHPRAAGRLLAQRDQAGPRLWHAGLQRRFLSDARTGGRSSPDVGSDGRWRLARASSQRPRGAFG